MIYDSSLIIVLIKTNNCGGVFCYLFDLDIIVEV